MPQHPFATRMKRFLSRLRVLIPLIPLVPYVACAQESAFRQYGQQDGLTNLSVTSIFQDHLGYIWVGTENGLFRHDGTGFEPFSSTDGLEDTWVRAMIEDPAGRLWVGTGRDLYVLEGRRFQPVRPDGQSLTVTGLECMIAPAASRLLVIDKGELFELRTLSGGGTWHKRKYFSATQVRLLPQLSHLTSLHLDVRGQLWLGCGTEICRVRGDQVDSWGVRAGIPKDKWVFWLFDNAGRLWTRGHRHLLVLNPEVITLAAREALPAKRLSGCMDQSLIINREGTVITSTNTGLVRRRGNHWEEFMAQNRLAAAGIEALFTSRDNTLWLGTSGHGLWQLLGYGTFESWSLGVGPSGNSVWAVLRDAEQTLTLGTQSGCLQLDASSRKARACAFTGLPRGEIQTMTKGRDNTLWLSMGTGDLLRVTAGQQRATLVSNIPEINKLFVDQSGRLWICTDFGIFAVSPGSVRVDRIVLPNQIGQVSDVVQDAAGVLWFATQGGLVKRSAERWVLLPSAPEAGGFIAVTPDDHGGLWAAGVSHGLMHLHVSDTRIDRAEWVADHNVANASVIFTQMDSRGWLWLGTDRGVVLFDGHTWRKFDHQDGLIWNDVNQNAVFADTDGSMWIGTAAGLTHVLRPEKLVETVPVDLRLGSATLGKTLLGPDTQQSVQWKRDLALDVHLQQLDFASPGKTLVKVRLRGLSDSWFETHDFNIHYPQLAPEQYTFEAIAIDHDHQRSSGLISVSFEVLPPWWETVWFKVALASLLGAIIAGIWKLRAYKLEARRQDLEQRFKEREMLLDRATRDALTRLWNRHAILEILTDQMNSAKRDGTSLAVALIDIDHFKRINDTMGHLVGDKVLHILGAQLPGKVRTCDSLGRYGGEELLLILPTATPSQPILLIERLRRAIAEIPFSYNGSSFHVTASLGVAWLTSPLDTTEDIIARADGALYAAKSAGRDRVEYAATGTSL